MSYADKNHTIVTIGDDIVYSAGKYMVLYRRDQTCAPRMRISQPDLSVTHITSMTTAPDHSRVAAIEQLEGEQRISFWDCNMHCTQPPIACSVQVGFRTLCRRVMWQHVLVACATISPWCPQRVQSTVAKHVQELAGTALGCSVVARLPVHCWKHNPSQIQQRDKGCSAPTWTRRWVLEVLHVLLATG